MPRIRNRTHETLAVPILGRDVAPGEVVDAPDEVNGQPVGWPESSWEPVVAGGKALK